MSARTRFWLFAFSLIALPGLAFAQATPGYTIHQVTFPGSFATYAWGVNDQKHVVGSYIAGDQASSGVFLRVGGSYKDLDAPRFIPFDFHFRFAINNHRHIAGTIFDEFTESGDPEFFGYEYVGGVWQDVAVPNALNTIIEGINDGGSLVGAYTLTHRPPSIPFLMSAGGTFDLPPSPIPGGEVQPTDINNRRQIVGNIFVPETGAFVGFLLENGIYTLLDVPVDAMSLVYGINDHGHIVGAYFDEAASTPNVFTVWRGFLLKDGGFKTINATRDASTRPSGINNNGDIVGTFFRPIDGGLPHGFLAVPKASK